MTLLMLCATMPMNVKAASINPTSVNASNPDEAAQCEILIKRLNEIKEMDKSRLTGGEKKQLRQEVRSIRGELNTMNSGGVYLSVGAIIIIILLLIILL
jgi:hypothetical protein